MLTNFLFLVGGCVLLYVGAGWLVHAAARLAVRFGISKSVIGLTLVAVGTSAPELIVNIIAGFRGQTTFALANVSGSNMTNIGIGFGLCGYTAAVAFPWRQFRSYTLLMLASAVSVLVILALFLPNPLLPYWSVFIFLAWLLYYARSLLRHESDLTDESEVEEPSSWILADIVTFLAGAVALYAGGELILRSAVDLALQLNIRPAIIGLTIVAAGTSIPDTIASLVALRRNESEIAVGNLLGSNVSNVVVVLSSTMLASRSAGQTGSLAADWETLVDYGMVCLMSATVLVLSAKTGHISRSAGIALIVWYVVYMAVRVALEIVAPGGI